MKNLLFAAAVLASSSFAIAKPNPVSPGCLKRIETVVEASNNGTEDYSAIKSVKVIGRSPLAKAYLELEVTYEALDTALATLRVHTSLDQSDCAVSKLEMSYR